MVEFTLRASITIDCPRPAVWEVLTGFEQVPRWIGGSPVDVLGSRPFGPGSRFHERVRRGWFWANFDLVCTEWDEGQAFAWKAKSFGVWGEHRWELQEREGGTLVLDSERFWGPLPPVLLSRPIFFLFGVRGIRRALLLALNDETRKRCAKAGQTQGQVTG